LPQETLSSFGKIRLATLERIGDKVPEGRSKSPPIFSSERKRSIMSQTGPRRGKGARGKILLKRVDYLVRLRSSQFFLQEYQSSRGRGRSETVESAQGKGSRRKPSGKGLKGWSAANETLEKPVKRDHGAGRPSDRGVGGAFGKKTDDHDGE